MFENLGFESLSPKEASLILGLVIGLAFGALAQITRFCLRRAVAGDPGERHPSAAVWGVALATAILGTQGAVMAGWISFDAHRLHADPLPLTGVLTGGLLFGIGMVLSRGCVSRLTVLSATGNLRAVLAVIVFAITAHAALKGVLAPLRGALSSGTVSATLPGPALAWTLSLAILALLPAWQSGARARDLVLAALLGLLVPAGWIGTGLVLMDPFDPIAMESLSFTLPHAEALFWLIASSSVTAGFGPGLIGGTLAGAALAAALRGQAQWQSFSSPAQTGRSLTGGALMGLGATTAGGCTLGAGLSGIASLSLAGLLALAAMSLGGWLTAQALTTRASQLAPTA